MVKYSAGRQGLFTLLYLLTFTNIHAQATDTLPFFVAKKGIYTSYTSLRNSVPNRSDSFRIIERTKSDIVWLGGGAYGFELESSDKAEWKALRKALVGISDGTQFYISDKYTSGGWIGLSKCYLKGPYIISLSRTNVGKYAGYGLIPSLITVGIGTVIDIRTREHNPLNESFIKDLLKKYPDLSEEYKDRKPLLKYAFEILKKVNEKENG